jgi:hypothetical protein
MTTPGDPPPIRRGDFVTLEVSVDENGRPETVSGMVILASANGASLMIAFDAIIDGCVGMMPLGLCTAAHAVEDPHYHNVVTGTRVNVHRTTAPGAPVH